MSGFFRPITGFELTRAVVLGATVGLVCDGSIVLHNSDLPAAEWAIGFMG